MAELVWLSAFMLLKLIQSVAQAVLQVLLPVFLCAQLSVALVVSAICILVCLWQGITLTLLSAAICIMLLQTLILAAAKPCRGISTNKSQAKKCEERFNISNKITD